jgi:hypothetical protein
MGEEREWRQKIQIRGFKEVNLTLMKKDVGE